MWKSYVNDFLNLKKRRMQYFYLFILRTHLYYNMLSSLYLYNILLLRFYFKFYITTHFTTSHEIIMQKLKKKKHVLLGSLGQIMRHIRQRAKDYFTFSTANAINAKDYQLYSFIWISVDKTCIHRRIYKINKQKNLKKIKVRNKNVYWYNIYLGVNLYTESRFYFIFEAYFFFYFLLVYHDCHSHM